MRLSLDLGLGSVATTGGAGFSPITAGAYAWWSADRTDLITLSGSQVTSWRDVVAGYNMVQAVSGARPVYSASNFNGAPSLYYDGLDDQTTLAGVPVAIPIGADPCEIWVVFDNEAPGADTTTRRLFNYGGNTSNDSRAVYTAGVAGTQRLGGYVGSGATAVYSTNSTVNAAGRHAVRLIINGGAAIAVDGAAPEISNPATPATAGTTVRSGLATNGAGPFNGKIRHIIVTPILTGDDLTAMWAWAETQRRA